MHTTDNDTTGRATSSIGELDGLEILVAEDTPDNQFLIKRLLTRRGARVRIAENGLIAMNEALSHDYDIIIMDVQMPQLDGHMATQKLRAQGYTGSIVALSAHAMKEARTLSLEVGCNEHLTKPVDVNRLVSVIKHYAGKKAEPSYH